MIIIYLILLQKIQSLLNQDFNLQQTLEFNQWQEKHNKRFQNPQEYFYRLQLYLKTDQKIQQHNNLNLSWELGHNQFSAMTREEINKGYLMEPIFNDSDSIEFKKQKPISQWKVKSKEKDWSAIGKTVPVRDQGACGSCYAFTGVDVLSSVNAIIYNPLSFPKYLSPQQIIDCGPSFDPQNLMGCGGALEILEVGRFLKIMGTVDEDVNPYQAKQKQCQQFPASQKIFLQKYSYVNEQYENIIKAIERAPVFVKIQANFSLLYYKSGVIDYKGPCGLMNDHVVQGIGYNIDTQKPYIKIQNSWNKSWGDSGYAKIAIQQKSKTGMCGILNNAVMAFY